MMKSRLPASLQVISLALSDWWDDLVNMAVISMAWLLSWLTIMLGPPATFGLYYATNRLAHGQSLGLGGLLEGARRYALKSWLWALLNLLVAAVIWANLWFYAHFEGAWVPVLQGFLLFLGLAWLTVQFYALPYLVEQEEKRIGLALRNALFTALAAPGYTLAVAGSAVLIAVLSVALVFPLVLGGPCLIAALGSRAVLERLEAYSVREREMAHEESDAEQS
jgi:uncharacterized membrane protein YesL